MKYFCFLHPALHHYDHLKECKICHVCVHEEFAGKGWGSQIIKKAEQHAINGRAKILQCTIRSSNKESIGLFTAKGYNQTSTFYNLNTGNSVHVFQKVVSLKN